MSTSRCPLASRLDECSWLDGLAATPERVIAASVAPGSIGVATLPHHDGAGQHPGDRGGGAHRATRWDDRRPSR
jgi:hypothetical protein